MYVFHASKQGKQEKFACWNGKIIHFGSRGAQTMELPNPSSKSLKFNGNVTLGNCEFRIFEDKLQVNRTNKRRCFKGEMADGEWAVSRVWVFRAN
jgi:hypothetical protein